MAGVRPIRKGEPIDEYSEGLARRVFRGDLRRNGEWVIKAHLAKVAETAGNVVLPRYRKIARAGAWLHDLVEDHGDKFEVENPFYPKHSDREQNKVYLNDLLEPAGESGRAVSFVVDVLTRRPSDLNYFTYYSKIFQPTMGHPTNFEALYTLARVIKLADNEANSGNDTPKVDVGKLWGLYQGFRKLAIEGSIKPDVLSVLGEIGLPEMAIPEKVRQFADYLEELGFFNESGRINSGLYSQVPAKLREQWYKELHETPSRKKNAEIPKNAIVGDKQFSEILGVVYKIHHGSRIIRGWENVLVYLPLAEQSLLVGGFGKGRIWHENGLSWLFEKSHNCSWDMIGDSGGELRNNPYLANSGLNRCIKFPEGYYPVAAGSSAGSYSWLAGLSDAITMPVRHKK